jgi:hypothetical protein
MSLRIAFVLITLCLPLALAGCCNKDPQTILDHYKGQPVKTILEENKAMVMTREASYSFVKKSAQPAKSGGKVYHFDLLYEFDGCGQDKTGVKAVTDSQGEIVNISTE